MTIKDDLVPEYELEDPETDQETEGPPVCYTPEQFRRTYQIGRTSYYNEVNAGRLTLKKIGHLRRIDVREAQRWWNDLPVKNHE